MTLKHKDMQLVMEIVNVHRFKRKKAPITTEEVAEMMEAMHTCGWIIVRDGDLQNLRKFVRRLEGRE